MNIKFYSGYSGTENIFSIRDSVTNFVSLSVVLNTATSQIQVSQQLSSGTWSTVMTSSTVTYGKDSYFDSGFLITDIRYLVEGNI